ncbi:MAG TPA: cyclodeaminase/cyclohydrolase family protein [Chloroflexota bacterium]|nr:cyclodeaminase/cyclohydrolase family protein [Chloroflexota bacterium]
MHTASSVRDFAAALASGEPVPGGGGGAALAGALGAALAAMVCNFTVGRKRYQAVEPEMRALLSRADAIRAELLDLVDADAEAYGKVVEGQALPKDTPEQVAERDRRIQAALAESVRVPLRVAVLAADAVALCEPIAERGNQRLISDAGVAALLADAALRSAALNVRVNLRDLRDEKLVSESRAAIARLLASAAEVKPRVMALVEAKIG